MSFAELKVQILGIMKREILRYRLSIENENDSFYTKILIKLIRNYKSWYPYKIKNMYQNDEKS